MMFRKFLLAIALLCAVPAYAASCQTFAAGDLTYITKLNLLAAGCTPTTLSDQDVPRAAAGGTVDVITATFTPAVTLTDKVIVALVSAGANTSATPTFAPNGLTARTIVARGGAALVAGDIGAAGFVALLEYNLANTRWELLNPAKLETSPTITTPTITTPTITGGTHTGITGLAIRSSGAAFDLTIATASVFTTGRTLTLTPGDASRTLQLTGNPNLSGITTTGTGTLGLGTKNLSISNSLTLAGTDNTVMTFPSTNATIARTDAANTFTGTQTFSNAVSVSGVDITTAWTVASAPTVTAGSGTFTAVSGVTRYKQIGKSVDFQMSITTTTCGTAGSYVLATLPVTANAATAVFGGWEPVVSNDGYIARAISTTGLIAWKLDKTYTCAAGARIDISGTYEAA